MDLYNIRQMLNEGKSIFDIKLRVTYYARVSTDKDDQTHSLKNQISYYTDFISRNPNWSLCEGYIDEGISGTSVKKRDAFLKMISDAKLGKFDFIITKEISRFSRSTLDSIRYTQELLRYGVGVLYQSDNINTLLPDSELRLTIMASIAQDEVRKISERVKFGFKTAIKEGVVLGNSKIWGYKKNKGKLEIDENEAEIVRTIFKMYATDGVGIRKICQYLTENGVRNNNGNPFSFSTIRGILANPKYKGYYCGNKTHKFDYKIDKRKYIDKQEWIMYEDHEKVPPIVSEELWDKANSILRGRGEKQSSDDKTSYQNKYTYSGKIVCMEHNVKYYRQEYKYKTTASKEVWQCKAYQAQGKAGCDGPIIYTTELDEIIKKIYESLIIDKAQIIHDLVKIYSSIGGTSRIAEDIAKVEVQINELLAKKDKLLELCIKGRLTDDEFEIRNESFNQEINELKNKLEDLKGEEVKNKNVTKTVETLRQAIANELEFEDGFNHNIIDSLVDRIEVYKTDDKKKVNLKVYLKVLGDQIDCIIDRKNSTTSVCSTQYT